MSNVLYLFGAGASAQALPIVNQIEERLKGFLPLIDPRTTIAIPDALFPESNTHDVKLRCYTELKWLHEELSSKTHSTIDTWAKKLKLREEIDSYNRLMNAFELFMYYEQTSRKIDTRYETWFASILNKLHAFPTNLRILSWNYDNQIELSYSRISNIKEINTIREILRFQQPIDENDSSSFNVVKLNGSFNIKETFNVVDLGKIGLLPIQNTILTDFLKRGYDLFFKKESSKIRFAWEFDGLHASRLEDLSSVSEIVIIGYSFPHFNNVIDRQILWQVRNLKKIVIQVPSEKSFYEIKSKILSLEFDHIKEGNIIPYISEGDFYISSYLRYAKS